MTMESMRQILYYTVYAFFYTQTQPNRVSSIRNTNPIRPETLLIIPNVSAVSRITIQLIPVNDFILQSATARKQF